MRPIPIASLFAALAWGHIAGGQTPPPEPPPVQPPVHSDGVIVIQVSNSQAKPLGGVLVVLRGHTSGERPEPVARHGSSDAAGRIRFADLANGNYWAEARMAGCDTAPASMMNTQLQGAKAEGQMRLTLQRRPVLTGQVVDDHGTPLLNAQVQAFRLQESDGERRLTPVSRSSTDDRGIYRMSLHQPGRHWIMAFHMEPSFPRGSAPRGTGVAFSPNSPDLLASQPVDLDFDQPETTLDIVLPPAAQTEIAAGILSGPDGAPCTRCRYSLRRVEGPYSYELTGGNTGGEAGFDTRGAPPGQYRVYVEDTGANQGWWAIEDAPLAESRTTGLTIYTKPPVAVAGRVILEDLPAEALEQLRERTDAVVVQAVNTGEQYFNFIQRDGSQGRAELPLEQSEFSFGPMPPGRFRIEVSMHGANCYLAGIKRQGRDVTSALLDFSQPGSWTDLEFRVRFDLAEPQFRLVSVSTPAAANLESRRGWIGMNRAVAYRLLLIPDPVENPFGRNMQGHCAGDGNCYVEPVPPGRYWAVAFHSRNEAGRGPIDRDLRAKLSPWGREIALGPGEKPTFTLSVAPDKAFSGIE